MPRITLFACLFVTCESCWRQIRLIKLNVSSIVAKQPVLVNSVVLRRLVMQVRQSPLTLTANQLFVIDYEALFAVSSLIYIFNSVKVCQLMSCFSLPFIRLLPQISCTCCYLYNLCLMLPKTSTTYGLPVVALLISL